jgi:hypothetical protein
MNHKEDINKINTLDVLNFTYYTDIKSLEDAELLLNEYNKVHECHIMDLQKYWKLDHLDRNSLSIFINKISDIVYG